MVGIISKPKPVNLIIGALTSVPELLQLIEDEVEGRFGRIDLKSAVIPFTFTDYYNEEMGNGIQRRFYSLEKLIMPEEIAGIKTQANGLEEAYAASRLYAVKRPINIDPGYINESRLILVSTKDFSHRIYLRDGIYAEVTLNYRKGRYETFPWTFPDFKTAGYHDFFLKVRGLYVEKLKRIKEYL